MRTGAIEPATDEAAAVAVPDPGPTAAAPAAGDLVGDELLVEEISIDGMCGVY